MDVLSVDRALSRSSYYAATATRDVSFAPLDGDAEADVGIVGGGLAGLSAAIELADRGFKVVVLEAQQVGGGASGRNGGQAIHGFACDQPEMEAQLGFAPAKQAWAMSIEALDLIRARCDRFGIDCDWQPGFLGLAIGASKARSLRRWQERMQHDYDYPLTWIEPQDMPNWIESPRFHSGIHDPRSGHLHPLKYCLGLAKAAQSLGVRIFENSPVTELVHGEPATLRTARGQVRARQVLLAGNVYLKGIAPRLESRIMPVGTYIVCTERLDSRLSDTLIPSRSAVTDTNFVLDYFRPTADSRLLYGGRVSYSTVTPPNLAASMHKRMAKTFPQLRDAKIEYAWGGFVDISMNRAPDFGRLTDTDTAAGHASDGRGRANIYYLQGFSGHGLALTGLAGRVVAEAMAGDASRFDVFARIKHRSFPGGRLLRTPALVLGMAYFRLKDLL